MPSFDLPGDPGEIRTKATGMRTRGTAFGSVATGLDKVSTDGWLSRAADLFREQFTPRAAPPAAPWMGPCVPTGGAHC